MKRKSAFVLAWGVFCVVLLAGVGSLAILSGKAQADWSVYQITPPTLTPTPFLTDTPQPTPTETPITPAATPSSTPQTPVPITPTNEPPSPPEPPGGPLPTAPPPDMLGWYAIVVRPELSLSSAPGFAAPHLQTLSQGSRVCVLEGPVRADELWWWKFRADEGTEGWGVGDNVEKTNEKCAAGGAAPAVQPGAKRATGALPNTGARVAYLAGAGLVGIGLLILVGVIRRRSAALPPEPQVNDQASSDKKR